MEPSGTVTVSRSFMVTDLKPSIGPDARGVVLQTAE